MSDNQTENEMRLAGENSASETALSDQRADIVRAFYDAAEKLLAARETSDQATQALSNAEANLEKVFLQADMLGSKDFSDSLKTASVTFFQTAQKPDHLKFESSSDPVDANSEDLPENR